MNKEAPMWEDIRIITDDYLQKILTDKLIKFQALEGQVLEFNEFKGKVTEINELIKRITGDQEDLFDQYRFHMFYHNGKYVAVRGDEIDTYPNFKKGLEE